MTASNPFPNHPETHADGTSFEGLWVALATPFDSDGGVDEPAFRRLIRHVVDGGVDGLLALGSTGEAATLTDAERDHVIAICLDEAARLGGTVPVLVGSGSNATPRAIAWTRRAAELGAHGALVVTPFYNKPNPDGMVAHYSAVAEAVPDLPLVIYNVPGRTGTNLTPELLGRLWQIPSAVALKESSGNLGQIDAIVRHLPAGKVVLSGDDPYALPSIALGAQGLVSVMANVVPRQAQALVTAARNNRFDLARDQHLRLSPLMDALFMESNPVPLKAGLAWAGLASGVVRPPLARAATSTRQRIASVLTELDRVAA